MKNKNFILATAALFLTVLLVFVSIQTTNNSHTSDQNNTNNNHTNETDGSLLEIGFERSERAPTKKRKPIKNKKEEKMYNNKEGETNEEQ